MYYDDVPDNFGGNIHRKADKCITMKGKNLSSVYVPDVRLPYGFGDVNGTPDALLILFHNLNIVNGAIWEGGSIELFVARGQSKNRRALYNLLADGKLNCEMEVLRRLSKPVG